MLSYWRKSGRLIYPYYKLMWKDPRLVWRSHKITACIECLMVAWVFFNWRVGQHPIWLILALLQWPKRGCSSVQHLKTQTCVKAMFNERTQTASFSGRLACRPASCSVMAGVPGSCGSGLLIQGWHHHRAGQGHQQPNSSVRGEDSLGSSGPTVSRY